MQKTATKKSAPPRYDDAFKQGAIHMVTQQKVPVKQPLLTLAFVSIHYVPG